MCIYSSYFVFKPGIRLISEEEDRIQTDATEAMALNHQLNKIDIYSNSWGPIDGAFFSGPGYLTEMAFVHGITKVNRSVSD